MKQKQSIIWADQKEMVWIPAGECAIGSDYGCSDEQPIHPFETKGFYMDATPVTNAEYRRFCDATGRAYPFQPPWPEMPDYFINYPNHPVVNVNHHSCKAYAQWAGKRLPTEEEWEYAAKGGQNYTYSGSNNLDEVGWYDYNSGNRTHPVAQKKANGYGLYDMSGNVWEWCWDIFPYYSDLRYDRGGSCYDNDDRCEVSDWSYSFASSQCYYLGFRIVCSASN